MNRHWNWNQHWPAGLGLLHTSPPQALPRLLLSWPGNKLQELLIFSVAQQLHSCFTDPTDASAVLSSLSRVSSGPPPLPCCQHSQLMAWFPAFTKPWSLGLASSTSSFAQQHAQSFHLFLFHSSSPLGGEVASLSSQAYSSTHKTFQSTSLTASSISSSSPLASRLVHTVLRSPASLSKTDHNKATLPGVAQVSSLLLLCFSLPHCHSFKSRIEFCSHASPVSSYLKLLRLPPRLSKGFQWFPCHHMESSSFGLIFLNSLQHLNLPTYMGSLKLF